MEGVTYLFRSLESNAPQVAEEARTRFHDYFNSTKEPWLLNGIFDYYIQSSSLRIVDIIVGVREPHERYFFDRMSESIRSSHNKLQALTLLGHVVCRHPSWLYKIVHHNLIKDLLKLLKAEKDVPTLMSALLIVIILLPTIAGLMGPYLQDLFDVFSHLASWNTNNPNKMPENQLLHLQVGLYALFNRLYGMYPCSFIYYLRSLYSVKDHHPVFVHTIKPMLETVRVHPMLVTANKENEVQPARWKKMEANDVIIECAKFSVETSPERNRDDCFRSRAASFRGKPVDYSSIFDKPPGDEEQGDKQVSGFSSNLPGHEIWSPTVYTGTTTPPEAASITHTPITQPFMASTVAYSSQEGNSPPEAAIEATPESTPVKTEDEVASLAKVKSGYYPPGSPLRLITPSPSPVVVSSPQPPDRSEEDKEVETTMQTNQSGSSLKRTNSVKRDDEPDVSDECRDDEIQLSGGGIRFPDSRAMDQFRRRVHRLRFHSQCLPDSQPVVHLASIGTSSGSSPREGADFSVMHVRRAQSCPEMKKDAAGAFSLDPSSNPLDETEEEVEENAGNAVEAAAQVPAREILECGTQTEDHPMVYEHMFLSVFPAWEQIQQHSAPPDLNPAPTFQEPMFSPRVALESYVAAMLRGLNERQTKLDHNELKILSDQVELLMYQLQFERHRREVHAERNRRLLGKSRDSRALEEHNSALRDQIMLMHRDLEALTDEVEKNKKETEQICDNLQKDVNYWKDQSNATQQKLKESENQNALLRKELDDQTKQLDSLTKKYALAQSQIADMDNTVQDTKLAASSSSELKAEIARLQHHLISAGELELRLRSSLNTLNLNCHKDMEAILGNLSYSYSLSGLGAELKNRTNAFNALKAKAVEVDNAVKKEEAIRLESHKLVQKAKADNKVKLQEALSAVDELKSEVTSKDEEILGKNAVIQKLERQIEKLLSAKEKEQKTLTALEKSRSVDPGKAGISDHLCVAAGTSRLQNLQNLVQFDEPQGSQ